MRLPYEFLEYAGTVESPILAAPIFLPLQLVKKVISTNSVKMPE
jgi:hypothetical protein